jgi:hypothetical protein
MTSASTDVSKLMRGICDHLHKLEDQQNLPEDYQRIIALLEKEANELSKQLDHALKPGIKIAPLNPELKNEIMHLMKVLQHSGPFMQVLGSFQRRLLKTFDRIKLVVSKWKPSVTKSEEKPIF